VLGAFSKPEIIGFSEDFLKTGFMFCGFTDYKRTQAAIND